jgi:hypothetical protein
MAKFGAGPPGTKKYHDDRNTLINELRNEKNDRHKLIGNNYILLWINYFGVFICIILMKYILITL